MALHHNPRIVTQGLVLHLDAADKNSYPGTGLTWNDLSGLGNNGTLNNGPLFSTDGGGSIVLDGSTKRVTLASPFGQTGFTTVSIWYNRVEAVSSTSWRTLFATTSTNVHHLISQSPSRVLGVFDGTFRSFGYTPPIDGKFHNYTVVYQSATNATLYVDGIFVSTITIVLNLATSPIGSIGNWNSGNYWAGYLNAPMIYNRALSQQEIIQNYNATKARFGLL
jgi:hypothetical protein